MTSKPDDGLPPPVRPLKWMAAVRDHPDRPPPEQCLVLDRLALRVDWKTGKGFASAAELAGDADVGERTVRRATAWARKHGLLIMGKRGHRRGDGSAKATDWVLCLPSQPVTGDLLTDSSTGHGRPVERISTGQSRRLNRTIATSQPVCGAAPSRPVTPRPVTPEPTGATSAAPTAQTILAAFIDWDRDNGGQLTQRTRGQLAKHIDGLLAEGIAAEHIKRGLADWRARGQHASTLHSFVDAALNGQPARPRRDSEREAKWARQLDRARRADAAERGELT